MAVTVIVCVIKVTTDPVELWSSPESRARQEKKYFDENFT
jgi:Niemann-Pick C1 protein